MLNNQSNKPETVIKNARMVSDGQIITTDLLIINDRIMAIEEDIPVANKYVMDVAGHYVLPGIIDSQVHFREPGFTYKADIYTETRAAAAGGVTAFIDMPNTKPPCLTIDRLNEKYTLGALHSIINYGFVLGVNDSNIHEVCALDYPGLLALSDDGLYLTEDGSGLVENTDLMDSLF
ncbi:MAG: amidohydrolase family protein, partial [Ferruginibacter sp.]